MVHNRFWVAMRHLLAKIQTETEEYQKETGKYPTAEWYPARASGWAESAVKHGVAQHPYGFFDDAESLTHNAVQLLTSAAGDIGFLVGNAFEAGRVYGQRVEENPIEFHTGGGVYTTTDSALRAAGLAAIELPVGSNVLVTAGHRSTPEYQRAVVAVVQSAEGRTVKIRHNRKWEEQVANASEYEDDSQG